MAKGVIEVRRYQAFFHQKLNDWVLGSSLVGSMIHRHLFRLFDPGKLEPNPLVALGLIGVLLLRPQ